MKKALLVLLVIVLGLCVKINAQSFYESIHTGGKIDSTISGIERLVEMTTDTFRIKNRFKSDISDVAGLESTVTSLNNFSSSFESWWGATAFRNYYNSGYKIRPNTNSQSVTLEAKQVLFGSGSPSPIVGTLNFASDWRDFTGSFATNQAILGIQLAWVPPKTSLSGTIANIWLIDNYITNVNTAVATYSPTNGVRGYSFRLSGGTNARFTNLSSFYSDLSNGATRLSGTGNYHFYANGNYPSWFGGNLNALGYNYFTDAQASDAYVVTLSGAHTLVAGLEITFKANTANTDGATVNVNGLGAKALTKASAGAINTALATGDILAGQIVKAVYDGTQFQVISRLAQ